MLFFFSFLIIIILLPHRQQLRAAHTIISMSHTKYSLIKRTSTESWRCCCFFCTFLTFVRIFASLVIQPACLPSMFFFFTYFFFFFVTHFAIKLLQKKRNIQCVVVRFFLQCNSKRTRILLVLIESRIRIHYLFAKRWLSTMVIQRILAICNPIDAMKTEQKNYNFNLCTNFQCRAHSNLLCVPYLTTRIQCRNYRIGGATDANI